MSYDVVIIGGGAAGLMCAIEAGKRERSVLLIEHAGKVGKKILISGGGRCNFTNRGASPANYLSSNEHFCKSALARYSQDDFVRLVEQHGIAYHEKKLGQLFCDESARQVVEMLLEECRAVGVVVRTSSNVNDISGSGPFTLRVDSQPVKSKSVVIATGGLSIPKMGATGFGYEIARQFGLKVLQTAPALVPFTLDQELLPITSELSGVALDAMVYCRDVSFRENILFTHRGLSGPAILQASSYWEPGESIRMDLLPDYSIKELLQDHLSSKQEVKSILAEYLPKRFIKVVFDNWLDSKPLRSLTQEELFKISRFFHSWTFQPSGTEGYRTAEVTRGGVSVDEISSKTFESKKVPGLFFIGEVLDVTGWLGGYNFQWAWSSGWCAGQYV